MLKKADFPITDGT